MGVGRYLVEDPASREVFVFGDEEWFLCERLNGRSTLRDIQAGFEKRFSRQLNIPQLEAFVRSLGEKGLLDGIDARGRTVWEMFQGVEPEHWKRWKLFNPERVLEWFAARLWWCYTWPFLAVCSAVFLLAASTVFFNFTEFVSGYRFIIEPVPLLEMFVFLYVFVNIPGELARGVTNVRYGGQCDEFGIWMAYDFIPRFYCLASVFEIEQKSRRAYILFTHAFYSALLGSIGVLMWKIAHPSMFLHRFGLIIAAICMLDLFIRLNFLWPTEAYYLLLNWLDIKDFRRRAIRIAQSWVFRTPVPEPLSIGEKQLFISYGIVTVTATSLAIITVAYFGGKKLIDSYAGIGGLVFLGLVCTKYRKGITGLIMENSMLSWLFGKKVATRNRFRNRLIFWGLSVIVIMMFPYPYEAGGPFKLLPLEQVELHTKVSGEIVEVLVRENDVVSRGDIQARLDQREHRKNLEVLKADLDKAMADLRLLEKGAKPEEVRKAVEQVATARTQADYSMNEEKRLEHLYREGVIPQEEYDAAAARADLDARSLEVAKAHLELVKSGPRPEEIEAQKAVARDLAQKVTYYSENVDKTNLLAPITGRVVTPYLENKMGHVLKEGDLFAIYENSVEIQAEVQIPEADIGEINIGARVKIRPYAYATRFFYGTVSFIAPKVENTPNGRIVRVLTTIPNHEDELKPEMTGEAKIEGGWKPAVVAFTKPIVRFFMVEVWSWIP